jgi:peroxiredoxin family protein
MLDSGQKIPYATWTVFGRKKEERMKLIAHTASEAITIASGSSSLGKGFPVYVIPWGMGNIPDTEFLCHQKSDVVTLWENYMANVKTPAFQRAHVIHCPPNPGPK